MSKLFKYITVFFVFMALVLAGLAFWAFNKMRDYIASNAGDAPQNIAQISIDKDAFLEKRRAFETFKDKLLKGECEQDFVLEGEDVNVLIKDDEEQKLEWTKWMYANVVDSYVDFTYSIPLGKLGIFKKYEGKFLNGDISCKFSYSDETPVDFYTTFRNIKFGEKVLLEQESNPYKQPVPSVYVPYLKAIKRITMEGNKITFVCKTQEENK